MNRYVFLTSSYDRAIGLRIDLTGNNKRRDIWKVRIVKKYPVQTLDDGKAQDYQVVGNGQILVRYI